MTDVPAPRGDFDPDSPVLTVEAIRLELARSTRVSTPELYCPFPPRAHGLAAQVEEQSIAWAQRVGLATDERCLGRLRASKIGWLASRAFPDARLAPLQLAADWTTLFCVLDDRTERIADPVQLDRYLFRLLALFRGTAHPLEGDGIEQGFADLGSRLEDEAQGPWFEGFIARLEELFRGFHAEADNRAQGIIPALSRYVGIREITVGLRVEFELGDLTDGIRLPASVRRHPTVMRLVTQACNIVGWANDIYTYEKEILQGEVHNLVVVGMLQYAMTLDEAVDWAVDMHDEETRAFEALLEDLPSFDPQTDEELGKYAAMLTTWVRGHLDWAHETGRYPTADGNPPSSQRWQPFVATRRRTSIPPMRSSGIHRRPPG